MNTAQLMSLLRTILNFAGGLVVSWGWLSTSGVTQVSGILLSIFAALWGWYTHQTVTVPVINDPGTTTTAPIDPPENTGL